MEDMLTFPSHQCVIEGLFLPYSYYSCNDSLQSDTLKYVFVIRDSAVLMGHFPL